MSKSKPAPMTREAATRMVKATAEKNGGRIPAGSVASRVDATVQRESARQGKPKGH
jgi:hypothetical protein